MKRYFVWKDQNCKGINPEWIEICGKEFYELTKKNESLKFISEPSEDDYEGDVFVYQATHKAFMDWDRECKQRKRNEEYFNAHYEMVSIDNYVCTDDGEELTVKDLIADTRDEDNEKEQIDELLTKEKIGMMMEEIDDLQEKDKQLVYALFLNPGGNMTETEYAKSIGISQQSVSKRKRKIFKNIRDQMKIRMKIMSNSHS